MRVISFTVAGKPQPWQRRVVLKNGASFMPREVESYKSLIRDAFHAAVDGLMTPHSGPVAISVWAFFAIPKSRPKWWKELAERELMPMVSRPDGDNVLKCYFDALNAVAWGDDCQVCDHNLVKAYSCRPRCDIRIELRELPTKETT